jgi:hypothetical protein
LTDLESIFKYTESGRYKEDGITFVVNNLEDIMIFTLYGSKVDDTIGESIGFRAINQKVTIRRKRFLIYYLIMKFM